MYGISKYFPGPQVGQLHEASVARTRMKSQLKPCTACGGIAYLSRHTIEIAATACSEEITGFGQDGA